MSIHTRLLVAILAALAIAVVGCGGDDTESGGSGASATQEADTATPGATEAEEGEAGEGEEEEEAGGADKDCGEVGDLDGKPKRKLPKDVPLVADARVYESQGPFGKTVRYFAVTDGGRDDLPETRDAVADTLKQAGYKVLATDQEAGAEAEAHLSGKHTVDIQVINLCQGKLRIRYTVS
jgi:hypothetical protein